MVVFYDLLAAASASSTSGRAAFLCPCLRVTEDDVRDAVVELGVSTVAELGCANGAGSGCTACHVRLRAAIARYSSQRVCEEAPAA